MEGLGSRGGRWHDPDYRRAYHRAYRAAHRERINAADRARRSTGRIRGDRSREYATRRSRAIEPLPPLLPGLQNGVRMSYLEDELRLDLHQEAELARLEGRDPMAAVRAYRAREIAWIRITAPLLSEIVS